MQKIPIGRIRAAAAKVRMHESEVTVSAIARILGSSARDVSVYVGCISGLREELGIVVHEPLGEHYTQILQALTDAGIAITYRRVSALTGRTPRAFAEWRRRNPEAASNYSVMDARDWHRRAIVTRARWVRYLLGVRNNTVLARVFGYPRAGFQRKLSEVPQLREILHS